MNLSRRDQYLLALLVVILIGFGFFRLVYLPMNKEIQTITANNQKLQVEKLQGQVKQLPKKTKETEDKFAYLNKRLPTEDEMIPLLTMLNETTGKYNLPFASLDYKGAEQPDETGAQTLVFSIGTKGNITQLFKFLDELEKAERLINVEDVSFIAVKAEAKETAEVVVEEPGPPTYYIAPPGIPEAKLQRIKFEVVEEAAEPPTQSERPVADSFMPGNFEMKMTIKAYYAATDESAPAPEANNESKPANDSGGEV